VTQDQGGATDGHEAAERSDDRLFEQRLEKLNRLREAGIDPYPARFERTDLAADVVAAFDSTWSSRAWTLISPVRVFIVSPTTPRKSPASISSSKAYWSAPSSF
jgi:lysyl-tRNA synthetase class II